jgi:low temperature requirement protein LtrA
MRTSAPSPSHARPSVWAATLALTMAKPMISNPQSRHDDVAQDAAVAPVVAQ